MTMTLNDHSRRRFGPLSFHHMPTYSSQPHFTDPWASSSPTGPGPQSGSQPHALYTGNQDGAGLPHLNLSALPRQPPASQHPHHPQHHTQHTSAGASNTSMASYGSLPVTAAPAASAPMASVYRQHDLLSMPQDPFSSLSRLQPPSTSAAYDTTAYTSTSSPVTASYATTSASPYDQLGYAPAPMRGTFALGHEDSARRYSQQSVASSHLLDLCSPVDGGAGAPCLPIYSDRDHRGLQTDDRRSFQDALEASHGMLSMSQETPRNIYDVRNRAARGSADSYGFPSTHSSTSSVSSNGFSGYYGGSVDGSISDYSATGSDIESLSGRTLPRPQGLMSTQPPAPQSMMGSFSSRVSSSAQKKHKCKVCDKRFTRPSSLQTHMYSHTGEKRKPAALTLDL